MTPRCLCCDTLLVPGAWRAGVCDACVDGLIGEALSLGDVRERVILAGIFRTLGLVVFERFLTRVPFTDTPAFDGANMRDHE